MNSQQRFELLSAYLDRELPPDQRQQVEQWLSRDPQAQQTYQNLLKLRYQLRESTVPSSHSSQEQLMETVVAKANRQTWKQAFLWGGGTAAAVFIALISGSLFSNYSPIPRLANSGNSNRASESLMIALNQPVVEMPKAPKYRYSPRQKAVSSPKSSP
ncbi:MAG: hypothetical protein BRC33_04685 [Cyanobacteria bacterium SW_9_44_58]|nr:MAG: hypothetical protein BRC33_04685 [Cyanobacteria bacterium SW_9_44_58]